MLMRIFSAFILSGLLASLFSEDVWYLAFLGFFALFLIVISGISAFIPPK